MEYMWANVKSDFVSLVCVLWNCKCTKRRVQTQLLKIGIVASSRNRAIDHSGPDIAFSCYARGVVSTKPVFVFICWYTYGFLHAWLAVCSCIDSRGGKWREGVARTKHWLMRSLWCIFWHCLTFSTCVVTLSLTIQWLRLWRIRMSIWICNGTDY